MKHEYTDLCQVLDMLNWDKVVKYLPRLNVTLNSVSAPQKMLYSGGGGTAVAFTHYSLLLSAVRKWKSSPGNNQNIPYKELRPLAANPIYLGLMLHNLGQSRQGDKGRLAAARWALPWAHLCHMCQGHGTALAPRGCRRGPQRQSIPVSPPALCW